MARSSRLPVPLPVAAAVALPGAWVGLAGYTGLPTVEPAAPIMLLVLGAAIIGAAFLIAWAAEAAQVMISAGAALAILAFLVVLPEYAVDFVFTLRAGRTFAAEGQCPQGAGDQDACGLALANMTGANRLLVGVGWPVVVLVAALAAARGRGNHGRSASVPHPGEVRLTPPMATETAFLGIATVYSLTLPLKQSLTLIDAVVLVTVFVLYSWRLTKHPVEEPELIGTTAWLAERSRGPRLAWLTGLFVGSAAVILLCAEHFADAAVETGETLGVDHFLLVQWVAPLASEAPELIVACLYAWRLNASDALGALLSSKVNQWTLLVGTIPVVFAVSSTGWAGLPLDTTQRLELLLTAAQALFAVALLVDLRLTVKGASALLTLFLVQLVVSIVATERVNHAVILGLSAVYVLASVVMLIRRYRDLGSLLRRGLTASERYAAPSGAASTD